jgi:hypothetical protein
MIRVEGTWVVFDQYLHHRTFSSVHHPKRVGKMLRWIPTHHTRYWGGTLEKSKHSPIFHVLVDTKTPFSNSLPLRLSSTPSTSVFRNAGLCDNRKLLCFHYSMNNNLLPLFLYSPLVLIITTSSKISTSFQFFPFPHQKQHFDLQNIHVSCVLYTMEDSGIE